MWMEARLAGAPNLSTRGSKSWATEMHVVARRKNQRKRKSSRRARQRDLWQCTNQRRLRRNSQPTQVPGTVRSSVPPDGVVILTPDHNDKTSLMICCAMTTQIKNYPFEVLITGPPANVVLADQVKSLDWRVRKTTRKGTVSAEELADVRAKILALIG